MKVVVTAEQKNIESSLDPRFGRAHCFAVCETDASGWSEPEWTDNDDVRRQGHGAGITVASNMVKLGAEAVISGHAGPKAWQVLKQAGIKVYLAENTTVRGALDAFCKGELREQKE